MEIDWQSAISTGLTVSIIGYLTNRAVYSQKKGNLKYGMPMKFLGIICFIVSVVPLYVLLAQNYQVDKPGNDSFNWASRWVRVRCYLFRY